MQGQPGIVPTEAEAQKGSISASEATGAEVDATKKSDRPWCRRAHVGYQEDTSLDTGDSSGSPSCHEAKVSAIQGEQTKKIDNPF